MFFLREFTTEKRLEFVRAAIVHYCPDLVFIDGVRDLLNDFNNIAESSEIVNLLMRLSSQNNCHICVILHENKADNNLRGHAGTELQNKSEAVISVVRDTDNTSSVSPKYCRNIDFTKFHFRVKEDDCPEYCEPEMKPKNADKLKVLFNEILPVTCRLAYSDLRTKVMDKTGRAEKTVEKYIKEAVKDNIIVKNYAGWYYSTENNKSDVTDDDQLPF